VSHSFSIEIIYILLNKIDLTNENLYKYFLHSYEYPSIIFGLRELNITEMENYCLNNKSLIFPNTSFNFSSNYELRIYTSACYYLDSNYNWQSDGLTVSSEY
jgi:hypothetical protein